MTHALDGARCAYTCRPVATASRFRYYIPVEARFGFPNGYFVFVFRGPPRAESLVMTGVPRGAPESPMTRISEGKDRFSDVRFCV